MKTLISFFCVLVFSVLSSNGAVWRVNNDVDKLGGTGNVCSHCFTDLQSAINSSKVAPGDTIHVEASVTNYGGITLSKKLTLLGTGYYLDENPNCQNSNSTSSVNEIYITSGASGSKMYGLSIEGDYYDGVTFAQAAISDILISNCKIKYDIEFGNTSTNFSIDNIQFVKCVINSDIYSDYYDKGKVKNLTIRNCYIDGEVILRSQVTGQLFQNVFEGKVTIWSGISFYNNISTPSAAALVQNNNSSTNIFNNLFISSQPAWISGGNNEFGLVISNVFNTSATTLEKILVPLSYCKECFKGYKPGGTNNEQIGMYGGSDPYTPAGLPPIPSIYILRGQTVTYQGDDLLIDISTKSNK